MSSIFKKFFEFIVLISVIAFIVYISALFIETIASNTVTAIVKSKERIIKDGDSYYLIFTDKGVFKNADSFFFLKFNSSDFHNEIDVGEWYVFETIGWRIPIISAYPNIVKYEKINCGK